MDPRNDTQPWITRFADWLSDCLARAQARDHDRYVAAASNEREVSQRLHRLEGGDLNLHP